LLQTVVSIVTLFLLVGCLVWLAVRFSRFTTHLAHAGGKLQWRIAVASLVWVSVSAIAYALGAQNYFLLGQLASVVAFVRFHPNWQLGIAMVGVGLPLAIAGFVNSLYWPSHSISEVLLLNHSIGAIFGGALASGYAFFLCGALSFLWGKAVGFPSSLSLRNGAPFTVESEAPEHVTHIGPAP
jgi:hypothetical protein